MRSRGRLLALLFCLSLWSGGALRAQYHSNGQDPFSVRWMEQVTDRYRLIYPADAEADARRVALVIDTAYNALRYGFSEPPMRLPIVLRTQNLRSNGIVVWTPSRAELQTTPPTETFATPWLKQLATHEYRHVVQMSNLNRHVIRLASLLFGEQAVGVSSAFVPKWFLEGDAVLAETAMGGFGRALQPEFTIAYRAYLADEDASQFSLDKWFCGSFRDYIPDHYHYGYQLTNKGYKLFGSEMWDQTFDFIARRPYLIFPRNVAFRRLYDTSSGELFKAAFSELKTLWDALPDTPDNTRAIATPFLTYTTYTYPLFASSGQIIAHKADFSLTDRLVTVDPQSGAERKLAYTGTLSSRPALIGDRLYWTEYQPSLFWEQRNRSVVRRLAVDGSGRARTVRTEGNLFYVTPYQGGSFVAVRYDPARKYSLSFFDADFQPTGEMFLPDSLSVHGMAWDEQSGTLALITLSEAGMGLTGVTADRQGLYPLTRPSFVSINHLSAAGGKFYFNSIASGKDEVHAFDPALGKEYRLTDSRFGSRMPSASADGTTVQTTYRREGYFLSLLAEDEGLGEEVPYSQLPVNRVNPPVYDFGLPNLDTMTLYPEANRSEQLSAKRYRRAAHFFRLHSWAPVSFNVLEAANNRNLDLEWGATLVSQNDLSDTEGYLSYGYVHGNSWWRGGIRFLAMAPKIEINAEYDGGRRQVLRPDITAPLPVGWDKKYFAIGGRVSLPFRLSSGAVSRLLTPAINLSHRNAMLYRPATADYMHGYQQSDISLAYSHNRNMALRDLAPRWGFGAQAVYTTSPLDNHFGSLWSLYGNVYLPGLGVNHSLQLRGAYQTQSEAWYQFGHNILFPRGVDYDFAPRQLGAALVDYRFPIVYPDGGIDQLIYIQRISANLFGGAARYNPFTQTDPGWRTEYSYGAEISVDFNPLRTTGTGFLFRLAAYRTSRSPRPQITAGLSISL
ncbi:MAG: hypothetical protein LBM20_01965 [Rikenellaceae bacterium]|nr:hypothetical protein [Rikenellaceae bacterium]